MKILSGKKLNIPLYHGTSTLFLDEIYKYGFGANNMLEELKVMDMLTQIYESCIAETDFVHEYPISDLACKNILSQDKSWQYNGLYLNTSKYTAFNHANINRYGSELLSAAMYLYEYMLTIHSDYSFNDPLHNQLADFLLESKSEIKPIVLRLNNPDIEALSTAGQDKEGLMFTLYTLHEAYKSFGEKTGDLFQINFILPYGKPIKADSFTIFNNIEAISDIN